MAVGDVYRLTRVVQIDGVTHMNVMHFQDTVGSATDPEEALVDAWDVAGTPCPELEMQELQDGWDTYEKVRLDVQRILPDEGEVFTFPFKFQTITGGAEQLPTYASLRFTLGTDLNSRSGKGGFRVGGIEEASTVGNILSVSGNALATALLDEIEATFTAAGSSYSGFAIGVLSRLLNQFNPATTIGYSTILGTTNSRKVGRGI